MTSVLAAGKIGVDMDIKQTIQDAIRRLKADGMTQAAIADSAGISPGRLSDFIAGKCDLTTTVASRLARAVGVTINGPAAAAPGAKRKKVMA